MGNSNTKKFMNTEAKFYHKDLRNCYLNIVSFLFTIYIFNTFYIF